MGFFDHRTGWIGELEPVALKQKLSLFVEPLPKKEKTEWLSEVSAVTLQQSLLNLNRASTNFFEGPVEEGGPNRPVRRHGLRNPRREWETEAPPLEDAWTHPNTVAEGASARAK
ncbi:hypothetical protein GGQ03_003358 [Salinibacter ruber]|uniref:hypothetical protein n=1 Tax=Salinibacter ruber TaxID=146919 RepID=UPI0021690AEA|nr:hypothetical protein [Salinibacter ruber]MCS4156052.1 hypothetical protein [Salinibacter ruber]